MSELVHNPASPFSISMPVFWSRRANFYINLGNMFLKV